MKKKNIGSSFDDWLREEDLYGEVTALAIQRVLERVMAAGLSVVTARCSQL